MVNEIPLNQGDIINEVYDRNLKSLRVSGSAGAVTVDAGSILSTYEFHDLDKADTTTSYIGYQDGQGQWLIKKMVKNAEGDIDMTYANISNNATKLTYAAAWTDRLTLTYDDIKNLTFIATGVTTEIYSIHRVAEILAGQTMYIMGITDGKQVTNNSFLIRSDTADKISIKFFEDCVYTSVGTLANGVNRDRTSSETQTMLTYQNPTITNDGSLLSEIEILGDKKAGDSGELAEPFILKNSSNYLYKITNNNVGTVRISVAFFWKEE